MGIKNLINMKHLKLGAIALSPLLLGGCATINSATTSVPNVAQMLNNLLQTIPAFYTATAAICITISAFLLGKAFYDLHMVAKMGGSMMGAQNESVPSVFLIVVAIIMMFIPTMLADVTNTLFGQSQATNQLAYQTVQSSSSDLGMKVVIGFMQFLGFCFFAKGLTLLSAHGKRNSHPQPGNWGKGMTHTIGGMLVINIHPLWTAIMNTLGLS